MPVRKRCRLTPHKFSGMEYKGFSPQQPWTVMAKRLNAYNASLALDHLEFGGMDKSGICPGEPGQDPGRTRLLDDKHLH